MCDQCGVVCCYVLYVITLGFIDTCHTTKGIRDRPGNDVTNGYLTTACPLPVLLLTVLTLTRGELEKSEKTRVKMKMCDVRIIILRQK